MTKKSENKLIALKEKQWDLAIANFWIWCGKVWKGIKSTYNYIMKNINKFLDWNFYYQPKNGRDRTSHMWQVFAVDTFIVLTIWAWFRLVLVY